MTEENPKSEPSQPIPPPVPENKDLTFSMDSFDEENVIDMIIEENEKPNS